MIVRFWCWIVLKPKWLCLKKPILQHVGLVWTLSLVYFNSRPISLLVFFVKIYMITCVMTKLKFEHKLLIDFEQGRSLFYLCQCFQMQQVEVKSYAICQKSTIPKIYLAKKIVCQKLKSEPFWGIAFLGEFPSPQRPGPRSWERWGYIPLLRQHFQMGSLRTASPTAEHRDSRSEYNYGLFEKSFSFNSKATNI